MAVYGSNTSFTNQLLLLGNRTYHVLMIRTWSERLDHLLKNNSWVASSIPLLCSASCVLTRWQQCNLVQSSIRSLAVPLLAFEGARIGKEATSLLSWSAS